MFILNLIFDIKDRSADKTINKMTIASSYSKNTVYKILYLNIAVLISIQLAGFYFLSNQWLPFSLLLATIFLIYFIEKSKQQKNLTWYLIFIEID